MPGYRAVFIAVAGAPGGEGNALPFHNFCVGTAELAGLRVTVGIDVQTLTKLNAYDHYYLISQLI